MITFDKSDPAFQEIMIACMNSTKVFAKTFFPGEVETEFSPLHEKMFTVIDDPNRKKKAIAAPRGLGKTTLAKIRVCKAIVFRETAFIIYLSNSASSAEQSTEHVKRMLQSNELIRKVFSDIKVSDNHGYREEFSRKAWTAFGEVFILPRGAGQQVRGLNWMSNRPGLVVTDDLESTELVRSDEQRIKLKKWFFSDLMKTEAAYGDKTEFLYIDTIKHEDALLQNLIDSDDWLSIRLAICDENFNTYDPNYMTTEEIRAEYEVYRSQGEADLFFMELMNIPISLSDAAFKPDLFKYYEENRGILVVQKVNSQEDEMIPVDELVSVIICDPARTANMISAESAVVAVSVHRKSGKIFVRDCYSGKISPDELYDVMFSFVMIYRAQFLGVEVTGLSDFISQPIKNQMKVRGLYPVYIQLQAKGKKEERVGTLAANYRHGYMYHNRATCGKLEQQLIWFPKSKYWDIMDALSYINTIMESKYMYFDPQYEEPDEPDETEFEQLEDDSFLDAEWRLV